ncbi:MAG: glycosyltransferase [Gammaproteobacteria bacterium]|nr:MAG: glycosyltransferase [Gammaproteobacteria bacterium]
MKISFIEPHLGVYGGIRRIVELSNRLVDKGHEVSIFHSDGSPCRWLKNRARTAPAGDVLDESHDVLLFNDPNSRDYALVREASAKLKVLYVLELYEKELLKDFRWQRFLPWHRRMRILSAYLKLADLVLVNATWEQIWLKEHLGIPSETVLGGVDFDMFRPVEVPRKRGDTVRILCSGDPRKRKGFKFIQTAFARARKSCPRLTLDTYHGKGLTQKELVDAYCSADIFIEASTQAGWNNPVAEAMACKVPVICTDIGGVADFAIHERTALLVSPGDVDGMTQAIIRLATDRSLRQRLAEQAFERIRLFPWSRCADRLEEILRDALMTRAIHE